jgi:hypothetical protein
MGAVSNVGPEVMDPQRDGKLELGYCSESCGDNRVGGGMLMGELLENRSSLFIDRNSLMSNSRPSSPWCDSPDMRVSSGAKVLEIYCGWPWR